MGHQWLSKLDLCQKEMSKDVYHDGYKRDDVITYRNIVFLPTLQLLTFRLMVWDKELQLPPTQQILNEQQALIVVTHDEYTLNANDGQRFIWSHDEHNSIRKKELGQGLHISELITQIGRLGRGSASKILKCDVSSDRAKLLDQSKTKAIPAFETEFPECQPLFMLDNTKHHIKYANDALQVFMMNLEDRGKNAKPMRSTFIQDGYQVNGGQHQSMVTTSGVPKGQKTVLTTRGLWLTSGP